MKMIIILEESNNNKMKIVESNDNKMKNFIFFLEDVFQKLFWEKKIVKNISNWWNKSTSHYLKNLILI
jgi:hypothetical protein